MPIFSFLCLSFLRIMDEEGCVAEFGHLKIADCCDYRFKASGVSKRKWRRNLTPGTWNSLYCIPFSTEFFHPALPHEKITVHCDTSSAVAIGKK
jgi:hypothetical protein